MATSAPRNSARRTIANNRSPIGMVAPSVPGVSWTAHGLKLAYSFFSAWICCCCCIGGCGCAGCGGSICCSLNSRWAISKLLGRWLAMSFSFCAMMSRAARVCGSVVDCASVKHSAAVLLSIVASTALNVEVIGSPHQREFAVAGSRWNFGGVWR